MVAVLIYPKKSVVEIFSILSENKFAILSPLILSYSIVLSFDVIVKKNNGRRRASLIERVISLENPRQYRLPISRHLKPLRREKISSFYFAYKKWKYSPHKESERLKRRPARWWHNSRFVSAKCARNKGSERESVTMDYLSRLPG